MNLNIKVNKNKEMNIGDAKQAETYKNRNKKFTVNDHLEKLLKSNNLINKNMDLIDFFNSIQKSIKSLYIINNDLFSKSTTPMKVVSLNFLIFLSNETQIFKNQKNIAINIKTNFNESNGYYFDLDRITILNNLEEEILLSKYHNYINELTLNFYIDQKIESTNINNSILKNILFNITNDVNIMKTDKNKGNGMVKLGRTLDFYRDYINDQKPKYSKTNNRKNQNIFPIVLRTQRSNDKRTEFIFRITKKEFNKDFINIVDNEKRFIYFYNVNDSDEKVSINRQSISFEEYKYTELLKSRIETNQKDIKELNGKIEYNKQKFLNQNKLEEINKLENEVEEQKETIQDNEEKLNKKKNDIQIIKDENIQFKKEIKKIEIQIITQNKQINKEKPKKDSNKNIEENYKINKDILEGEIEKLRDKIEKKQKIISENNIKKELLEKEIASFEKTIDDIEKENDKNIKNLNNLQKTFNLYKNQNEESLKKIKELSKEVDSINFVIKNDNQKYLYYTFKFDNTKLGNLRAIDVKKIYDTDVEVSELLYFSKKFDKNNHFVLSDEDYGMFTKHKRFYNSLQNFKSGEYKNPLLAKSIEDPDFFKVKQSLIDDYDLNMHPEIKLNKKQELAVKKAILTPCISYLQGPPGTGKTQTISALIHHIINNKEQNVLLMSSTHEAILNAFDRIKSITEDDPNFIMYKTIRKKLSKKRKIKENTNKIKEQEIEEDESNIYDLDHAFYNFSLAIINSTLTKNKNDILDEIIDKLKIIDGKKLNKHFLTNKKMITLVELIKKNSKNFIANEITEEFNKWTKEDFKELLNSFENEYSLSIKDDIIYKFEDIKTEIDRNRVEKIKNNSDELLELLLKNKRINDLFKEILNNNIVLSSLNPNRQKETNQKVIEKLQLIKDRIESREDDYNTEIKNEFSDYIYENELINLIGLTTTANQVINPRKESNDETKELFLQYPIYMTIVDEVSKSSTLEIINSCMLSEKILLAGDYKQLPPVLDFETGSKTDDQVESIEVNKLLDSFKDIKELKNKKTNENNKISDRSWFFNDENVRELISELKYPFFKFHALKLKANIGDDQNFYTFLTEQHRFNKNIQKVVNVNYDYDEKLTTPIEKNSSYLVNYKYPNIKINKEFIVMDTSKINREFIEYNNHLFTEIQKEIIKRNNYISFDQTKTLDKEETKESTINEYNAFVIAGIVENIVLNNSTNNEKFDLDKIGIISMTRSQNSVIKKYLKDKNNKFKQKTINKVKVDTVDNFQGREKEIIIVDFVRAKGVLRNNTIEYPGRRNYEFYKSSERINVAVSRAKDTLILVGAFDELEKLNFNISTWDKSENKIKTKSKKILKEYIQISKDEDTFRKVNDERNI
ncbi:AAA domain-containing protein [Mycoplasma sp. CSL7503-lung]|uniref:AAA domain-containing protein n=1 Tax=Mycoplasma sp. CSL7503-lung TaxID=536372 RepID=UPI0021D13E1E|nr:AAA domain-containing protein [Mycoplasma sp. CSL7503-lung]MCU4706350.1 AAA domain-containing protein [Mycoplasma sp. CSL7503-lung]